MCIRVGKVTISIGEQSTPGKEISKGSLLRKGKTVVVGNHFVIATAGKQCIFMPVTENVQNTLRMIVSTFVARGVRTIEKEGKISVPIHVCVFVPIADLGKKFDLGNIDLRSIQTRYAAVKKEHGILVRRDT